MSHGPRALVSHPYLVAKRPTGDDTRETVDTLAGPTRDTAPAPGAVDGKISEKGGAGARKGEFVIVEGGENIKIHKTLYCKQRVIL